MIASEFFCRYANFGEGVQEKMERVEFLLKMEEERIENEQHQKIDIKSERKCVPKLERKCVLSSIIASSNKFFSSPKTFEPSDN